MNMKAFGYRHLLTQFRYHPPCLCHTTMLRYPLPLKIEVVDAKIVFLHTTLLNI